MNHLVTLNPAAHRALAVKWALRGFAASGHVFNGETHEPNEYPAIESMLVAHFEALYEKALRDEQR
jgi:hypothetical protein